MRLRRDHPAAALARPDLCDENFGRSTACGPAHSGAAVRHRSPGPRCGAFYPADVQVTAPQIRSALASDQSILFMYAALVEARNDTEVKFVNDGGRPSTSGALVSSVRVLKDYPNSEQDAAFFIFPDICVRLEGSWRFKLSLFVIQNDQVRWCAATYSAPFFVYPGKQYPGVQVSTPLTRALAAQGVRLRIRKEIREKSQAAKEDSPPSEVQEDATTTASFTSADTNDLSRSPPKRRRTLLGSVDSPPPLDMSLNASRFPHEPPSPPSFYGQTKMQYDSRFRRASLDTAEIPQRPHPQSPTREWATTSRVLPVGDYRNHTNFPAPSSPSKSDNPDPDYSPWEFVRRPAHPSPESSNSHASIDTPYVYPGTVHRHLSSDRCTPAPTACPSVYSWSPIREGFNSNPPCMLPESNNNGRRFSITASPTAATPAFWQALPRGDFEHANTNIDTSSHTHQPLGWVGHAAYSAPMH
ncbi:velvet factor-domain-containing protein [Mycena galericulata]|nr:velvet factor-domain-containing protein [Mycena galericulata]